MLENCLVEAIKSARSSTDPCRVSGLLYLEDIDVGIQKPLISTMYDQLPRLLRYSVVYDMIPRWNMRPDYCSYDIYGSTNLAWFVMFVNTCPSLTHFTTKNYKQIYGPREDVLSDFINYVFENKKKV